MNDNDNGDKKEKKKKLQEEMEYYGRKANRENRMGKNKIKYEKERGGAA